MMMLPTSLWLLLILISCSLPTAQAQRESRSCSEDGVATCAAQNRLCVAFSVTGSQEERCGPCIEGYVEFPDYAVATFEDAAASDDALDDLYNCFAIDELQVETFIERFQPQFIGGVGNATERLLLLIEAARYVAEFDREQIELNSTVELALNQFAMDTPEEEQALLGYRRPPEGDDDSGSTSVFVPTEDNPYPSSIDWRELGAVTSVKNQGRCGCCWALSTVGALEGAAAIASNFNYLQSLSQQQLISCDKSSNGCDGGFPAQAFDYADDQGVATWEEYPYTDGQTGVTTEECTLKGKPVAVEAGPGYRVNWYGNVGDDTFTLRVERLKSAVAQGPVAISMNADCPRIMFYRRGILTDDAACQCTPQMDSCLNHAVLLVGYNDDDPVPYWIIKNSWGALWGERGFFRVAQLNPDETEDSYGLFGLLAEGIIPKDVFQSTDGKTFTQNERRPTWWKVMVACLIFLGVCVVTLIGLYIYEKVKKGDPQEPTDE